MRPVVVGAAGGSAEDRALDFALTEAIRRRLPLLLVRAYQPPSYGELPPALLPGRLRDLRESRGREATTALARARDRIPAGRTVAATTTVMEGDTASCLLAAADSAALLVVGARAGGVISRVVHGSVAASCLQKACGPVAVVPHDVEIIADRWLRSRVLVGLDGSAASLAALTWAVAQAREWGCVLVPVVVSSAPDHPPVGFRAGAGQEHVDLTAKVWTQVQDAGGGDVEVHPRFVVGDHKQQLLQLAQPADLLVVGGRRIGAVSNLLTGPASSSVALRSRCPVVVVRDGQARREIHQRRAKPSLI
jgi:nucleotide-binding universal stress UspA family protein